MFGSLIADREIYRILSTDPAISDVVGDRIFALRVVPAGNALPAILFYPEQSAYDSGGTTTRSEHITGETLRYVVRVMDEGTSTGRIKAVAESQLAALAGLSVEAETGEQMTFAATGEFPLFSEQDGARTYRYLGTVYNVSVDGNGG